MLARSSGADPFGEVLQDLRLADGTYGRCSLTSPWGIRFPPQGPARFHFVAAGRAWLHTAAGGWLALAAGDVVLLPHGAGHALADRPGRRTTPLPDLPLEEVGDRAYRLRAGGGGAETLLACCSVSFEEPSVHPLIELMPPLLLLRAGSSKDPTLPALLEAMAAEVREQRLGAATVLTRLADAVITRLVRDWVDSRHPDTTGWLAAIRDPRIGRVLASIHRRPGHAWSVAGLARVARVSRSVFAERFAALVGMPPAQYLARWRMHLATRWLRNDRLSVGETATRLGYQSEAAFSRAFKRAQGVPPSTLRRPTLGRATSRQGRRRAPP